MFFLSCLSGETTEQATKIEKKVVSQPQLTDVLLITVDTLRADRVGAYGDELAQTPTMDALAAEGVLFQEAYAVTPLTLPSHASPSPSRLCHSRHG